MIFIGWLLDVQDRDREEQKSFDSIEKRLHKKLYSATEINPRSYTVIVLRVQSSSYMSYLN